MIKEYLISQPSEKLPVIEIPIPCSSECLVNSKFKDLLSIPSFKSQIEVVDSLKDLLNYKINDLLEEVTSKISDKDSVDIKSLSYSIYKIVEYGGDYEIGYESLKFDGKTIYVSDFNNIMKIHKEIEMILSDENVKATCHEIRYLSDSLWEHFEKNIRRSLNEVQNRT